jgi:hypothetical protein
MLFTKESQKLSSLIIGEDLKIKIRLIWWVSSHDNIRVCTHFNPSTEKLFLPENLESILIVSLINWSVTSNVRVPQLETT